MSITNGYCTLDQLRAEIGTYGGSDDTDNTMLELSIEAASRQIDAKLGYRLWQDSALVTREFYPDEDGTLFIPEGISTTTGLVVALDEAGNGTFNRTITSGTDFLVLPSNAADEVPVRPYTEVRLVDGNYSWPSGWNGRPGVRITAKFGWPAVPDWAEKACLIQSLYLFKAKDAAFGIAAFGDAGAMRMGSSGWHPAARALIDPHALAAVG